ncbi:hypothetical protein LI328DRAFT_164389 [Trichoderma asperelloides]|nr:hypothetical protein LI328DRAFT_164389 [Trichoderma asperelloides]
MDTLGHLPTTTRHDIFCTPENSNLHSRISYRALHATKRKILPLALLLDDASYCLMCLWQKYNISTLLHHTVLEMFLRRVTSLWMA